VGAAAAALTIQLVRPDLLAQAAIPIAVVAILIGIPHGAADHLVPFWSRGRRATPTAVTGVVAVYVAGLLLVLACALRAPVPALWAFLLASALHFGRGEVVAAAEAYGRQVPRIHQDLPVALAHGAAVIGLMLSVGRDSSLPLLDRVAPGIAYTPPALLTAVAAGTYVLVGLAVARLVAAGRLAEAAELVLLTAMFTLVPPAAAFGVYFAWWHATRHTARLVALPDPHGAVDLVAGVRRYARAAALPTAGALVFLIILARVGSPSVLDAQLIALVAITAPHLVVVAAFDSARARWARPSCG
jgi:Brp/Blh family beta-carotene 15,15'-monooxygenase